MLVLPKGPIENDPQTILETVYFVLNPNNRINLMSIFIGKGTFRHIIDTLFMREKNYIRFFTYSLEDALNCHCLPGKRRLDLINGKSSPQFGRS